MIFLKGRRIGSTLTPHKLPVCTQEVTLTTGQTSRSVSLELIAGETTTLNLSHQTPAQILEAKQREEQARAEIRRRSAFYGGYSENLYENTRYGLETFFISNPSTRKTECVARHGENECGRQLMLPSSGIQFRHQIFKSPAGGHHTLTLLSSEDMFAARFLQRLSDTMRLRLHLGGFGVGGAGFTTGGTTEFFTCTTLSVRTQLEYFLNHSALQLGLEGRLWTIYGLAGDFDAPTDGGVGQLDPTFRWLISLSPWLVAAPSARLATTYFPDQDYTVAGQPLKFETVNMQFFTGLSFEARVFFYGMTIGRLVGSVETTPIENVGRDWIGGLALLIDFPFVGK